MRLKTISSLAIGFVYLVSAPSVQAQRGGRGGGGMQRGGGGFGGGLQSGGGGMNRSTGAMGPYGGSGTHSSTERSGSTAYGGQYQSGSRSGTYDTQRGGTINYGAAGASGTGAGGTSAGRGVYGVSGTTAGGKSYSDVGRVGGVQGPGGNSAYGRSNAYAASGPNGAVAGGSRYGAASGPNGTVAGGSRYGAAEGPNGYAAGGTRYGAAATPNGYAAGGAYGYGAAARPAGTYYNPYNNMAAYGNNVRVGYAGTNYASPAFYGSQPGAWAAAGYAASAPPASYGAVAGFAGYPQQPVYNDYGGNVVSQGNSMYVNGDPAGTPQQYAQQAGQLANSGAAAQPPADDTWMPLGVYAAGDDQSQPNDFFQLAINKQGVIRGNYHNAAANKTTPVSGQVDPKTMRAAWIIGQDKAPVFEAGIANLTKDQTTMLVHDAQGKSTQTTLVRLPAQDGGGNGGGAGAAPGPGGPANSQ